MFVNFFIHGLLMFVPKCDRIPTFQDLYAVLLLVNKSTREQLNYTNTYILY